MQNHLGSSVQNYIVAARTAQGYEEWHNSSEQERLNVISQWHALQVEVEKEKHHTRHGSFQGRHCYLKATIEERKRHSAEKKKNKKGTKGKVVEKVPPAMPFSHPFVRQSTEGSSPEKVDFEEAIKASVAATSHGDPEEDKMIERAIRASVEELHLASKEGDDKDALQRAIQASVTEANRVRQQEKSEPHAEGLDGADDHNKALEAALHRSLQDHHLSQINSNNTTVDFDDSGVDTDDDENIKLAIERSKSESASLRVPDLSDDDLRKAMETSKKDHEKHELGLNKSKTEEEIVLDYTKRQSLAEERLKRNLTG